MPEMKFMNQAPSEKEAGARYSFLSSSSVLVPD